VGVALERAGYNDLKWAPDSLQPHVYGIIANLNEYVRTRYGNTGVASIPPDMRVAIKECVGPYLINAMRGFDSASDYPLGHECVHPYIRKLVFPAAKFIFLTRDRDAYVKSVAAHQRAQDPDGVDRVFMGLWAGHPELGADVAWSQYQSWHDTYLRLRDEFPKDVLVCSVTEGWRPIMPFIQSSFADATRLAEFPWENRSSHITTTPPS
jgi:hypothetical protein